VQPLDVLRSERHLEERRCPLRPRVVREERDRDACDVVVRDLLAAGERDDVEIGCDLHDPLAVLVEERVGAEQCHATESPPWAR
jgi:hypothetical protein